MTSFYVRALAIVCLGLASMSPALAQQDSVPVRVITDCPTDCPLGVREVVSLGERPDEGFVSHPGSVIRFANGTYALIDYDDGDKIKLFDRDGTYLRAVGRKGEGPGEFSGTPHTMSLLPGDSIEVFDQGHRRFTVFGPDWDVAWVERLAGSMGASRRMVRMPDGTHVFGGRISARPEGIGLPLHAFLPNGEIRSFGSLITDLRDARHFQRRMAVAGEDRLWVVPWTSYSIRLWELQEVLHDRLVREADWFEPHSVYGPPFDAAGPPSPSITDIHQDDEGLLWVAIQIADDDWQEGGGTRTDIFGGQYFAAIRPNLYYDGLVEVIDPISARVVGRIRLDERPYQFVEGVKGALLVTMSELEGGEPFIRLLQFESIESSGDDSFEIEVDVHSPRRERGPSSRR